MHCQVVMSGQAAAGAVIPKKHGQKPTQLHPGAEIRLCLTRFQHLLHFCVVRCNMQAIKRLLKQLKGCWQGVCDAEGKLEGELSVFTAKS